MIRSCRQDDRIIGSIKIYVQVQVREAEDCLLARLICAEMSDYLFEPPASMDDDRAWFSHSCATMGLVWLARTGAVHLARHPIDSLQIALLPAKASLPIHGGLHVSLFCPTNFCMFVMMAAAATQM